MNKQINILILMISLVGWSNQAALAQCITGAYTSYTAATGGTGSSCNPADCDVGFSFEVCFDVLTFTETVSERLHGVYIFNLPAGATIAAGTTGAQQTSDNLGNWIFVNSGTFAPIVNSGWYVDYGGNNNPTDNLGDPGEGDCDQSVPCIESFLLDPFCFNITFPPGSCTAGEFRPSLAVSTDAETGNSVGSLDCILGRFPSEAGDALGPNCDGFIQYGDATSPAPANDLIFNATSIDAEINAALASPFDWSCDSAARLFSSATSVPRPCPLTDDTGADVCDSAARPDIWYSFTGGSDVWIDFYQDGDNADNLTVGLYEGTPSINANGCTLDGLTYISCASGAFGNGGPRDVGVCTTVSSERIDVSGLTNGATYYLRVWPLGGTLSTTDARFYLCVESNAPKAPAVDACDDFPVLGEPTVGCLDNVPDRNITDAYLNLSNVGAFGVRATVPPATCDPNNGAFAGNVSTLADFLCDGSFTNFIGSFNPFIENNVFYSFEVNGSANCAAEAEVTLQFDNINICCGETFAELAVTSASCGSTAGVMVVTFDTSDPTRGDCVIMQSTSITLPNGLYFISAEANNAALMSWDMILTIDYNTGVDCNPTNCGDPLPVDLMHFTGNDEPHYNMLEWATASEENTEWFIVERSSNGTDFREIGRTKASGTTTTAREYSLKDLEPPAQAYYRLKLLDFDGYYEYSKIINIERKTKRIADIMIFPVPVKNQFTLQYRMYWPMTLHIDIYDIAGNLVQQKAIDETVEGINQVVIDLSDHQDGMYFVVLNNGEEKVYQKIVKGQD